jgi:hypothetical protein
LLTANRWPKQKSGPNTEVCFDLVAHEEGMAYNETTVPFVPVDPDGIMSVVVHVMSTNTDSANGTIGSAGARQACFPVSLPQWIPTASPSPSPTEQSAQTELRQSDSTDAVTADTYAHVAIEQQREAAERLEEVLP